jgi:hypothetical protein
VLKLFVLGNDGSFESRTVFARYNYHSLFFEPVLKALFFYFGSLGLLKLKYGDPISYYPFAASGKRYISVWDGLGFIKLTELGKYVFGLRYTYDQKEIVKKTTSLKFDEYKPIITVDKQDTIMLAKLEPFVQPYDENRYILSYAKIFRDCDKYKALELKIDSFYKHIEQNPPKVFDEFFDEIKQKANLLKRELKQVVIKLDEDKKLLNLFMTNGKLQELIIKAEGYRIIVLKENIPKVTKILKDNGFYIDF